MHRHYNFTAYYKYI